MAWQGIEGHDDVADAFRRALARGRLASTFLFVGPEGIGKRTFAEKLAQALLCQNSAGDPLAPCGECASCRMAAAGTHPDLLQVARPADKSTIPVELFIGSDERRMREGLCHDIALRPLMGGRKVALIHDADDLNREGANCLLKVLEEPPPRAVLILLSTSAERQLPTIRSRCQVIRFRPLPTAVVSQLLIQQGMVASADEARQLAMASNGSLKRSAEWMAADWREFRSALWNQLAAVPLASLALAQTVGAFVDEAGKEAVLRRARFRQVMEVAAEFFRHLLRDAVATAPPAEGELMAAIEKRASRGGHLPAIASQSVDRCLMAIDEIQRNANQTTLIECWADDLSQIAAGRRVAIA